MGLTTLNQALICTLTPNLMGVIWSESMISQAFQACYSIEGCLSDRCVLAPERNRVYDREYLPTQPLTKITPFTLKRITFTTSRASEMKARAKEALPINLHSEKYIRILQMLETQLKRNRKGNSLFYHSPSCLSSMTLLCSYDSHHLPVLHTSQTWPCDPAPPSYFTLAHRSPNPELAFFYSKYGLETHDSVS